ncbi:MAG TPA: histidine kinase dimerization/phospho-acceptor domain-containing protein, partial [Anaerolineae bacterium]|nr:histidine kinase dimerization/phospho-acceptor domain-containing protein [Anaerolineae bacterium]
MTDLSLLLLAVLIGVLAVGFGVWRRDRGDRARLERETLHLLDAQAAERERAALAEAQLTALGRAVLEVIVIVDRDLRVTYATPGARSLFGATETATGLSLITFTRSNELDQLAADALTTNPDSTGVRDFLDRQIPIDDRPFRARAVAFGSGVVLALSDVSELQRLGRARRDFVANISHELRTPLTSIRLVLDGLLSGAAHDPREVHAALRKIQVEIEALSQMTQELLDLAQIESGRALMRMVPTPVAQLIDKSVERLLPQAARRSQTVSVEVAPDLVVLADVDQVSRAFGNLLHNAIKFTQAEGRIEVRARAADGD